MDPLCWRLFNTLYIRDNIITNRTRYEVCANLLSKRTRMHNLYTRELWVLLIHRAILWRLNWLFVVARQVFLVAVAQYTN